MSYKLNQIINDVDILISPTLKNIHNKKVGSLEYM